MSNPEVVIIGGGLSGLSCARRLHAAGVSFQLLEASDDVGGRARTDVVDGFLLDRGFQVLLTAYPEAREILDYDALDLARFSPGALVRFRGKFHRFADPWRSPQHLIATAFAPIGTAFDKLRVAWLRRHVCRGSIDALFDRPETTTIDSLRDRGFSPSIIERFFRPFLGGVFLERELQTSSRMFEFVFRMFATGDAVLPANGMGAIARQIADRLPSTAVRTESRVASLDGTTVRLATGEELHAERVVIACDAPAAAKLLGAPTPPTGRSVTCLYFAADKPPVDAPILVLNGDGSGPINNLCVPSQAVPAYAPPGQSLISATVLGSTSANIEAEVRAHLVSWFGVVAQSWRHLRTYRIPFALPAQSPPALSPVSKPVKHSEHVFRCGDYLDIASIQGAMISGRRAGEAAIRELGR